MENGNLKELVGFFGFPLIGSEENGFDFELSEGLLAFLTAKIFVLQEKEIKTHTIHYRHGGLEHKNNLDYNTLFVFLGLKDGVKLTDKGIFSFSISFSGANVVSNKLKNLKPDWDKVNAKIPSIISSLQQLPAQIQKPIEPQIDVTHKAKEEESLAEITKADQELTEALVKLGIGNGGHNN